jgi:hypothetical protein
MEYTLVLIDKPAPYVRRLTLNRPHKRNALNATFRREIIDARMDGLSQLPNASTESANCLAGRRRERAITKEKQ